jgi:hypothetical protein
LLRNTSLAVRQTTAEELAAARARRDADVAVRGTQQAPVGNPMIRRRWQTEDE